MFDSNGFRERLRNARRQAGYSQKELAQLLYVSTQAVSKWERGTAVPDLPHVCRIGQLLRVSVDALLGAENDLPPAVIAVDGGGTKTEFLLVSPDGTVLQRQVLGGSNPNTCTINGCVELLSQGLELLLQRPCRVLAACIGGAGMASGNNGSRVRALLQKRFSRFPIQCRSDIHNLLAQARDPRNAIAVICGTGSVVFASREGELLRCGGGGWRLETLGSGYDLGRGALLAALEHRDGTGPETALTARVEEKLGGTVWDKIQTVYTAEPAFVASFAPLVLECRERGDRVAEALVTANCDRIAQLIQKAHTLSPGATQVMVGGSVLTGSAAFRQLLADRLPSLTLTVSGHPPVWGAVLGACAMADIAPPDSGVFQDSYDREVKP